VIGDVLRVFERTLVLEIGDDAGCAEGVAADTGLDTGCLGAALNHPVGVHVPRGVTGERPGLAGRGAEEGPSGSAAAIYSSRNARMRLELEQMPITADNVVSVALDRAFEHAVIRRGAFHQSSTSWGLTMSAALPA
jgi:hypothetical protein